MGGGGWGGGSQSSNSGIQGDGHHLRGWCTAADPGKGGGGGPGNPVKPPQSTGL